MHILICNERLLFRFGADRTLIILGARLRAQGHTVTVMVNRCDEDIVQRFAKRVLTVPSIHGRYLHLNEDTAAWLRLNWNEYFAHDGGPDVVLIGGWPFFAAIPFLREVVPEVCFVDFGAVPVEGYSGGMLTTQNKLREMRIQFLPHATRIIAISDFIRRTQSIPDSGGQVPTDVVLLAADHVDAPIWEAAKIDGANPLGAGLLTVRELQGRGFKTVLNLGRWESGCYKNSQAALTLVGRLLAKIPNIAMIVLAEPGLEVPAHLAPHVRPIGFPDDSELVEIMKLVDLGVSVSLWEGLNLPLAEMQWLDRPALAFDVGAHPEVVLLPWYLCSDLDEMVVKAETVLRGGGPGSEERSAAVAKFRKHFSWSRVAEDFAGILKINSPRREPELVLIDVSNSTRDPANSGVIRVSRRLSRALQQYQAPLFVVWEAERRRYVLPTREEYDRLGSFNGPVLTDTRLISTASDLRMPLDNALELLRKDGRLANNPWLLLTETMIESRFRFIRAYARALGFKIAAIFYDAIPVLRPDLCNEEMRSNHADYMIGLASCDLVLPISEYSASCLLDFWKKESVSGCEVKTNQLPGEFGGVIRTQRLGTFGKPTNILCVSTLEPRKNHRRLIEACLLLEKTQPQFEWSLNLVGNRYAGAFEIAEWVQSIARENPRIRWHGIVDDHTLHRLYEEAAFTVYPSIIEGFGIPILESIWHGRPCICSDEGVMAELAAEGGCLTTNVQDVESLAETILSLSTNEELWRRLSQEALRRSLKTWDEYSAELRDHLRDAPPVGPRPPAEPAQDENPICSQSVEKAWNNPGGTGSWTQLLYPKCIQRHWQMHDSERLAMTGILARHRPFISIEIGTYFGGSLSLISQFSEFVISIDVDPDVPQRIGSLPNVHYLTGKSEELLPELLSSLDREGVAVDFVLIDADHSAEGIQRDLSIMLKYVPKRPLIMLMHDSFNPECRRGMIESPWDNARHCHWVDLDFVPGRIIEHSGPSQGELWGGLAMAYFAPEVRNGPLTIGRSVETMFQSMSQRFQSTAKS